MIRTMDAGKNLRELVERAQAGEQGAFDELVDSHWTTLESFVRSRLGEQLATRVEVEDIVQESLLRAFRSISSFELRGDSSVLNWLCGIAKHVILEAASRCRRDNPVALDFEVDDQAPSPSHAARREERFDRLQQALDSLSPEYREVVLLVRVDGLPVREVAKKLNRTPHAVSNLLLRATRKLKDLLGNTESLSLPDRSLGRTGGENDG